MEASARRANTRRANTSRDSSSRDSAGRDSPRRKVLFIAEAVTLAHLVRPYVLAAMMDEQRYEVHFAHHPRYRYLLGEMHYVEHEIESIEPSQFMAALARGAPLYDEETLEAYVQADLALFEKIKPDFVVGDFRLSLGISAELAGVPYVAVSNAYWSPYTNQRMVIPELPLTRLLGVRLGQCLFDLVKPIAFSLHARPFNRVRRKHGLSSLGGNLRQVYTHADHVVYADVPGVFDTPQLPDNHHFIGPLVWSPPNPVPAWWGDLPPGKPVVYVCLGSSGRSELLPGVLQVLGELDISVVVSTAGMDPPVEVPTNAHVARFLPGEAAVSISSLVICNGGSPATQQALALSVPVIGISSNMDQCLNMNALQNAGVGFFLRSEKLDKAALHTAVDHLMTNSAYKQAATRLADSYVAYDGIQRFLRVVHSVERQLDGEKQLNLED